MAPDAWEIADRACLDCGERYQMDLTRIRREPTEEERSKKARYMHARADGR